MKVKWRLKDEKYINWKLHSGHNFVGMEKKINCETSIYVRRLMHEAFLEVPHRHNGSLGAI
jgi:hypothetical protein